MSELSVRQYLHNDGSGLTWGYDKREADKYIALLKDKANYNEYAYKLKSEELADTCRFYEEELRHQKYRRCLAMAMWCSAERDIFNLTPKVTKVEFFARWHKRWLAIAEKLKEAK